MSKIEGPQVMAAIVLLAAIGIVAMFAVPNIAEKILIAVITPIGMLGMKLLDKNGGNGVK